VAIADALGPFRPAVFDGATTARIDEILDEQRLGGVVAPNNPLDLTPNCRDEEFAAAVEAVLADSGVDVGVVGCVPFTPSLITLGSGPEHDEDVTCGGSLAAHLVDLWRSTTTPWVAVVDAGTPYDPMVEVLEQGGIPTFRTADRALRMLGRYVEARLA